MAEGTLEELRGSALDMKALSAVASEDIDIVLDDFSDAARFIIACTRAAARRQNMQDFCAFVHSDATKADTDGKGFVRIAHMQDGHGELSGALVVTNREAHNGMTRLSSEAEPAKIMEEIESLGLGDHCAVIWDPTERVATVYPSGTNEPDKHARYLIPFDDAELTQDEVCSVLSRTYNENLCNPSGHTVKLWVSGKLISQAEDELERHLKGQLSMALNGKKDRILVYPQPRMTAGRADLLLLQRSSNSGPRMMGLLELKVLRGPTSKDRVDTKEGLSQGYHYRKTMELPFATLALFDVADPPSYDPTPLLEGQEKEHIEMVRVRRLPIYKSPKAWRDAGGHQEAA